MLNNITVMELNMNELTAVTGGGSLRDHPMYDMFKESIFCSRITIFESVCRFCAD